MKKRRLSVILSILVAVPAFGQFGPPAGGGNNTLANQVPLSGRTGQAGSVTATQAPVAGTTTSVNTINPSIQPQGPYSGSALSTPKMPFAGKLSLTEAVKRGLDYNLGTVGLNLALQQAPGQALVSRS